MFGRKKPDAVYTLPGGQTYQPGGGVAGDLTKLAGSGDVEGILKKVSELSASTAPPDEDDAQH